jgi:uncharacterized protein (TIGR03089 family)
VLSPLEILDRMVASDSGRPRLTWYDDEPGPTQGERIELSARVLANWVAKAGNLLQDDLAAEPGTTVGLDLPAHWRSVYWAMATWAVGATVVTGADAPEADVLVTDEPSRAAAHGGDAVLVSLAALARSHPDADLAPGAVDEARELSTHGDVFSPLADPEPGDLALVAGALSSTYGALVHRETRWGERPRLAIEGDLADVLTGVLSAWSADGSVVLSRGVARDAAGRLAAEGATVEYRTSS